MGEDIARWAKRWGLPFAFNPHFPINMLTLMRAAAGLQLRQPGDFQRHADAVFHAMGLAPRHLGDASELAGLSMRSGQQAAKWVGGAVAEFIAWARGLHCGIDLAGPADYQVPA